MDTVVDSISSVIYLGVSEHATEVLKSSEQFIVQFYTPSLTPTQFNQWGSSFRYGSAPAMTVLQKDNTKYQIAPKTLDAELAIAEAKICSQAFVTDNILVGPSFSPSQYSSHKEVGRPHIVYSGRFVRFVFWFFHGGPGADPTCSQLW